MERKIVGDSILFCVDGKTVLTLKEYEKDGSVVLQPDGELRSDFVHDFQDELIAFVTVGVNVVVDMGKVSYLSSTAQNAFLTEVCRSRAMVTVFLVNGVKLQGFITYFDDQVVLLRRDDQTQLVYKHAISTVMPSVSISLSDIALTIVESV